MAKTSAVERNKKRERLAKQYKARRAALKAKIKDRSVSEKSFYKALGFSSGSFCVFQLILLNYTRANSFFSSFADFECLCRSQRLRCNSF